MPQKIRTRKDIYKLLNKIAEAKIKEAFYLKDLAHSIEQHYKHLSVAEIKEKVLIPILNKLDERARIKEDED